MGRSPCRGRSLDAPPGGVAQEAIIAYRTLRVSSGGLGRCASLFLLSVENATISAMIMIVAAVAARAFTTALLSSSKKDYDKIREQLHGARAELGFERERLDSAKGVMSFNERQKDDLVHRIQMT